MFTPYTEEMFHKSTQEYHEWAQIHNSAQEGHGVVDLPETDDPLWEKFQWFVISVLFGPVGVDNPGLHELGLSSVLMSSGPCRCGSVPPNPLGFLAQRFGFDFHTANEGVELLKMSILPLDNMKITPTHGAEVNGFLLPNDGFSDKDLN